MKRGQVSFEYLIITAFLVMLIIPSLYMLYLYSGKAYTEIGAQKINDNGNTIMREVENIWYLGYPAKTTMEIVMPDRISKMEIVKDTSIDPNIYEILFIFEESEMVYVTSFPIKGYYMDESSPPVETALDETSSGSNHWQFKDYQRSEGVKTVIIQYKKGTTPDPDHVGITIK